MTSFPVCKKTSLSRKRCLTEVKLLLNTNRKLVSPIQNPSLKTVYSTPKQRYNEDGIFGLQENLIMLETAHDRRKLSMKH